MSPLTSRTPRTASSAGNAHPTAGWMRRTANFSLFAAALLFAAPALHAQLSLSTAVDLALQNSPRIQSAQAELTRATAALKEAKDVYIPAISGGAGLGDSFGYTPNPPTLFTFSASSLAYNAAQFANIRSARAGLDAVSLTLESTRQDVASDAALSFLNLQHDTQRKAVLDQQFDYAQRLVQITQDRLNAGQDTPIDLTQSRLTLANLRLARLQTEDNLANDRDHLAHLIQLPAETLSADTAFPALPPLPAAESLTQSSLPPAVASAFANARAKQEIAHGDARYLYRPQITAFGQYNRYASFASSLKFFESPGNTIPLNEEAFGIGITVPLFDRVHKARAQESAAEASKALHDAEQARLDALEGQSKLTHTIAELEAHQEIAALDQQLAQQQLAVLQIQLNTLSTSDGPQITPKDEQVARIAERDKYLTVLDTTYQLRVAQIDLLRETGRLIDWLKSSILQSSPPRLSTVP